MKTYLNLNIVQDPSEGDLCSFTRLNHKVNSLICQFIGSFYGFV